MIQRVIYVAWLPHCHRSKLIRWITCHTQLSRGSCGFTLVNGVVAVLHWFSCVRKTVVQSYSHSPLPTECKGEPWLNNSSQTSTHTRSLTHTLQHIMQWENCSDYPPQERGPVLFNWCFGPPLMRAIDWPHNPRSAASQLASRVQTAPWEIQNPTITRKWPTKLFRDSQHRKCAKHGIRYQIKRGTIY